MLKSLQQKNWRNNVDFYTFYFVVAENRHNFGPCSFNMWSYFAVSRCFLLDQKQDVSWNFMAKLLMQ